MILIRYPHQASDPEIQQLIADRMQTMADGEDFDPEIHGYFLRMEPQDSLATLEQEVGPVSMVEIVEEHPGFYEAVFVPDCGDLGIVVLIPKEPTINADLLQFCQTHAVPI